MTERDVMLLPVQIISSPADNNGGLVKFPGGREIILGKTDADALRAAAPVAGRADSIRERGRYYDIIVEALVDYDGWMLDDDYDATPVLNRIMKRMRDRLEMSAPPLPTQPAREEVIPTAVMRLIGRISDYFHVNAKATDDLAQGYMRELDEIILGRFNQACVDVMATEAALAQSPKAQEGGK